MKEEKAGEKGAKGANVGRLVRKVQMARRLLRRCKE